MPALRTRPAQWNLPLLLGLVVVAGWIVRLESPGRIALWADEAQFLNVAALPSLRAIVAFLRAHESHPPLYYFLGHLAGAVSGNMAATMSAIMLLVSTGVIAVAWWVAGRAAGPVAAVVSALLVAVSLPLAFLQVQLRPYAVVSLLLLVTVGALLEGRRTGRRGWKATWVAASVLLLYTHHLGVLILGAETAVLLLLEHHRHGAAHVARAWLPWIGILVLLAVPDLALLLHQQQETGYLPGGPAHPLIPFRQFGRLMLTFPGELAIPVAGCGVLLARARRIPGDGGSDAAFVSGTFLLLCLALILTAYRHGLLVEHVVLPMAPLGMVGVGMLVASAMAAGRRLAAAIWIQLCVVGCVLSTLFTIGITKTSMDRMAGYIDDHAAAGDLVVLFPGSFGAALNWYLEKPLSQIDYPVTGPVRRFEFDHAFARITDTLAFRVALDSIASIDADGRRVWYISPTRWLADDSLGAITPPVPRDGEAAAYRARSWALRRALRQRLGPPRVVMTSEPKAWTMEALTLERFGAAAGS